jgi:NAD(P)-dependent dehydrogenase (short-subunit alcohol dehydrogenase family)
MSMKSDIGFNFSGRTVIVFGGSRGIGKEICRLFANSGATVYNASRTPSLLESVIDISCDLQNANEIKQVFSRSKTIDFVINVAGTNLCEPIEKITVDEWDRLMNVNLKSFFIICKEAVRVMKKNNYGRIVNVSSIAGRNKSIVSGVHYTSSKYGIIGLTKQLANEVSQFNILVNCVCPSQTMTEMLQKSMNTESISKLEQKIPVRRISTTTEQALPVLFLCSSAASYIAGAAIDINGGQL